MRNAKENLLTIVEHNTLQKIIVCIDMIRYIFRKEKKCHFFHYISLHYITSLPVQYNHQEILLYYVNLVEKPFSENNGQFFNENLCFQIYK